MLRSDWPRARESKNLPGFKYPPPEQTLESARRQAEQAGKKKSELHSVSAGRSPDSGEALASLACLLDSTPRPPRTPFSRPHLPFRAWTRSSAMPRGSCAITATRTLSTTPRPSQGGRPRIRRAGRRDRSHSSPPAAPPRHSRDPQFGLSTTSVAAREARRPRSASSSADTR